MNRAEFMEELERLLYDISSDEREEALQYYNGYFEDAGEDHEDEIIKELGSPDRVASIIKADLNSDTEERQSRGYFTENGYQDTIHDTKFEIVNPAVQKEDSSNNSFNNNNTNNSGNTNQGYNSYSNTNNSGTYNQNNDAQNKNYQQNTNIGLIILIGILTLPITLPILGTAFGLVVAFFGVLFGLGIAGVCMMGAGVALFIIGILKIGVPFLGLLISGSGLICFGLGMLFVFVSVWLCKIVIPAMINGIVTLCKLPFKNRSVAA